MAAASYNDGGNGGEGGDWNRPGNYGFYYGHGGDAMEVEAETDFNGFCNICRLKFLNSRAVQHHQDTCHHNIREVCPDCRRRFENQAELGKHADRRGHGASKKKKGKGKGKGKGRRVEEEEEDQHHHNNNNN